MSRLLSAIYFFYFFSTAVALLATSIVLTPWCLLFDRNRRLLHYIASAWGYHFVLLNPRWKCRFDGRENVNQDQTYVIVANHQSIADTFILSGLSMPFKWVAKESLFRIPFFGWNMFFTQYIPVQRQ